MDEALKMCRFGVEDVIDKINVVSDSDVTL